MELTPTFLFMAATTVIGAIVWLLRLEGKTNGNSKDIEDLNKHAGDAEIHHRADDLDRRFDMLITAMGKIETSIDKLMERFDKFLMKN